jgi:hypothetical protein
MTKHHDTRPELEPADLAMAVARTGDDPELELWSWLWRDLGRELRVIFVGALWSLSPNFRMRMIWQLNTSSTKRSWAARVILEEIRRPKTEITVEQMAARIMTAVEYLADRRRQHR